MNNGFRSLSILLPTLNETFSFIQTVETVLEKCNTQDICEFIAIVCDRTTKESLDAINEAKGISEKVGVPLHILYQTRPFAGGATQDGMDAAVGSHTLIMSADLETDPNLVPEFIRMAKEYPSDMITASRWIGKHSFDGYSKIKLVLNFFFQKIFSAFYGVRLTDITFGYRLAPTELFQAIKWEELKHPFFLETALKPIRLGVKIHEIPTVWVARLEGESANSLLATFKYLGIAFRARFEKPKDILKNPEDAVNYKNK